MKNELYAKWILHKILFTKPNNINNLYYLINNKSKLNYLYKALKEDDKLEYLNNDLVKILIQNKDIYARLNILEIFLLPEKVYQDNICFFYYKFINFYVYIGRVDWLRKIDLKNELMCNELIQNLRKMYLSYAHFRLEIFKRKNVTTSNIAEIHIFCMIMAFFYLHREEFDNDYSLPKKVFTNFLDNETLLMEECKLNGICHSFLDELFRQSDYATIIFKFLEDYISNCFNNQKRKNKQLIR